MDASHNNMFGDTELGKIAEVAAAAVPASDRKTHKRKRSRYYEAEVHSSEADVESEDLPSFRLTDAKDMTDVIGRKSLDRNLPISGGKFTASPNKMKSMGM